MTLPKETLERIERAAEKYAQAWAPDNKEAKDFEVTRAICAVAFHAHKAAAIAEAERAQELVEALIYYADENGGPYAVGDYRTVDGGLRAIDALARYREGWKK